MLVDSFVKWRIDRRASSTTCRWAATRRAPQARSAQTVNDGLRAEFGKRTVHDVVSGERDKIMDDHAPTRPTRTRARSACEVVDVRLKRVDLPPEVASESVYRRMEAERKRVANELRSTGRRRGARRSRADADRQQRGDRRRGLPRRPAHQGRGRRQGRRASTPRPTARTPSSTPSTAASRPTAQSFRSKSDVMVLEPSSDFFKYLKSPAPAASRGGSER
ncbi:MAG: SPFH domain-containing protein [Chromatiales bacterium]|nr:SPFH domain-containing protein [Chromatiales bacterium]